ncbi:ABC transporter ATP-binding protein [archaeon SCG-AAA382B04]|nr:ABC transporter ATP-binding protein [archaeon SCG-AAA382B04]
MNEILRAKNVFSGYTDLNILEGVSIEVEREEIVSIIGPNGAGKSTLLKTIFGLLETRKGKIYLRNEEISNLKPNEIVKKGMGYVPQSKNIFPSLTVEENLEMGSYIDESGFEESKQEVLSIFPDLKDKVSAKTGDLSGGQQQMVAMGRALILDPDVILLDEPSAGLSPELVNVVFEKIKEINKAGMSILVVEQNARKILKVCDRGYVLEMGENRLKGTGKELLNNKKVEELYLGG